MRDLSVYARYLHHWWSTISPQIPWNNLTISQTEFSPILSSPNLPTRVSDPDPVFKFLWIRIQISLDPKPSFKPLPPPPRRRWPGGRKRAQKPGSWCHSLEMHETLFQDGDETNMNQIKMKMKTKPKHDGVNIMQENLSGIVDRQCWRM